MPRGMTPRGMFSNAARGNCNRRVLRWLSPHVVLPIHPRRILPKNMRFFDSSASRAYTFFVLCPKTPLCNPLIIMPSSI